MRLEVFIVNGAEQDLKDLRQYLTHQFSIQTWQTSYSKLKQSIRSLQEFPESGVPIDELQHLNQTQYRQIISGMNRIIYEIRQNAIYIHIIADTRRDMTSLLYKRLTR